MEYLKKEIPGRAGNDKFFAGMTTFILCAMFFVFIFSPMGALHNVGLLSIIGLAAALVADYTLTTALVYVTKPYGREKRNKQVR